MHAAAERGNRATVQALIDANADVHRKDIVGKTALFLAAERGDSAIVRTLIDAKADINMKNVFSQSLLHLAVERDSNAAVRALLNLGAQGARCTAAIIAIRLRCTWLPSIVAPRSPNCYWI